MFTPENIQNTSDLASNSESNLLGINNATQDVIVGYLLIHTAQSRMEKSPRSQATAVADYFEYGLALSAASPAVLS